MGTSEIKILERSTSGELKTLTILRKKRQINLSLLLRSYIWSTVKMTRRLPLAVFRKMTWKMNAFI